jgi:hypothetical protein
VDLSSLEWRKSRLSGANGCVEVAGAENQVVVRDSKDPGGPVLLFSHREWTAFVGGACAGEFDDLLGPQSPHRRLAECSEDPPSRA